jgi:hypothetical protein
MPVESVVRDLDGQLQKFHPGWSSAPVFTENPGFKPNLVSSLAWGLGGESLTFAEIELTTKTTGAVRIVAFTKMTIVEIDGLHDAVAVPNVRVVGRSGISSVEINEPDTLVPDPMFPSRSVMTVTIGHETLGNVTVGTNEGSRGLIAEFVPSLFANL